MVTPQNNTINCVLSKTDEEEQLIEIITQTLKKLSDNKTNYNFWLATAMGKIINKKFPMNKPK